jgi:hypothetical protein
VALLWLPKKKPFYVFLLQCLLITYGIIFLFRDGVRVSVQGVKSLGGHFACLCQEFQNELKIENELKKNCYYFSKRKWKHFYTFNNFYSEKSSKRAK